MRKPVQKLKPPPDNEGNIRGRMAQLRRRAHSKACGGVRLIVDGKNKPDQKRGLPEDYDKKLEMALKDLNPEMQKLEQRLKKCSKSKQASPKKNNDYTKVMRLKTKTYQKCWGRG